MFDGPRKPWLAVVLTLLCPGLGHLYCGRIVACLVFFLLSLAMVPAAVAAVLAPPSDLVLGVFLVCVLGMVVLAPWAVVDAWRSARRAPREFVPREYQRPVIYLLFIAGGVLCPMASSLVLRGRFLRAYVIASDSMAPALEKGDRVFTNGVRYEVRKPERGDVVTFREPGGTKTYVKRVVGLPGDLVEVRNGEVFVNGEPYVSVGSPSRGASPPPTLRMPEFRLSPEEIYVLGDAIANSRDSRDFGPVPLRDVDGPVEYRYWSRGGLRRIGTIDRER